MSGRDGSGSWPAWARYLLFAVLAAIVVTGVVLAAAGGELRGAALRILLAAVVVPALLLPLQAIGLRRRAGRSRDRLYHQVAELRFLVTSELDVAPSERATGASDEVLRRVSEQVDVLRSRLPGAPGEQLAQVLDELAARTREWPADAAATRALAQCRRTARTLQSSTRRGPRRGQDAARRSGVTTDGHAFRVQPRWKEEVLYWEDDRGYLFDAGWGVTPPVVYVPSATMWDDVVPEWMTGRRDAVVGALLDTSGHVLFEDVHGWYRSAPESRVLDGR